MSITGDFKQSSLTNAYQPVSSMEEFDAMYSVNVALGMVAIAERISGLVKAQREVNKDQYRDFSDPSHFHKGVFYFVLSSHQYKMAKYVYSFDPEKKQIQCFISHIRNPNFIQNILVEFGSGFIVPGPQVDRADLHGPAY